MGTARMKPTKKVEPVAAQDNVPDVKTVVLKAIVSSDYLPKKIYEVGKSGVTAIAETDQAILVKYGENRLKILYRRFLQEADLTLGQVVVETPAS